MDDLLHNLSAHRRRIKGARTADAALRWAFYVSVAGCIALAVSKVAGLALPLALAGGVLGAIPLAAALREWARAFSLRDCAIHLDRLLGGSLLLAGALLTLPSPDRSGTRMDPALAAVSAEQAARLESLARVDVQFKEVAEEAARALQEGRPEKALAILEELRKRLAEKLLEGGGVGAETQKLLDAVTASAASISAELARLGRTIHAAPPVVAQAKLDRQRGSEAAAAAEPAPGASPAGRSAISQDVPWDARYDPVIRRYLGIGREP